MSLHRPTVKPELLSWLRRLALWVLGAVFLGYGVSGVAYAVWQSTDSSNFAAASADSLPQGSTPTATATNATTVAVSWAAGTTTGGRAVTGYTVARYNAATGGTKTSATGGCAGTVASAGCTEQNVPGGTWYYTVTPALSLWTGADSARSAGVTVDSTPPTVTVASISPAPNANGYNNTSPVTVNLSATDTGGSGVASITYWVDSGTHITVNAATAAVSVAGEGTHIVSYFATDSAGNVGTTQTQPVKIDTVAPGAPTVSVPGYVNGGNVSNVPVSGTAEANATVVLTVTDAGAAHTVTQTVTANGSGTWSTSSLNLASLNQGTITYAVTATDAAGNTGVAGTTTDTKDTVAPTVLSINRAGANPSTNTGPLSFTVTFNEPATNVAASSFATATSNITGTPTVGTPSGTAPTTWTINVATAGVTGANNGSIGLNLTSAGTIKDAAGNTLSTSSFTGQAYTYDTTPPALGTPTAVSTNGANGTVSGTAGIAAGDLQSVTVTLDNGGTATNPASVNASTGAYSTAINIQKGTSTVTVTQTDAAGNVTTKTTTVTR
jgi:hypothetical protein